MNYGEIQGFSMVAKYIFVKVFFTFSKITHKKIIKIQRFIRRLIFRKYASLNIGNYIWGFIERMKILSESPDTAKNCNYNGEFSVFYENLVDISKTRRPLYKSNKKQRINAIMNYFKEYRKQRKTYENSKLLIRILFFFT